MVKPCTLLVLFAVLCVGRHDYLSSEPVPRPKYVAHEVEVGASDKVPAKCRVPTHLAW